MQAVNQGSQAVTLHTGATVNGVQTEAEVLMQRHTPKDWPNAATALNSWEALCRSLDAQDKELRIKDVFMNPQTGGIYNNAKAGGGPLPSGVTPTRTALGHLLGFVDDKPREAVDNLEYYPPAVRAQMLAYVREQAKDRTVVLRTAVNPQTGGYVVRAVASEKHSQENGDDLAIISQLRRLGSVLDGARMRVVKQWDNTHVELVIPTKVREVKAGVVIQARINIENSETKGGSFLAQVGTLNLRCINGMVGDGAKSTVSVKHMGDIRQKMRLGVVTTIDLADIYLDEYVEAYRAELPKTRAEAIEATVKRFKLPETTGQGLVTVWDMDGEQGAGHTVAGLANALTRYAQTLPVEQGLKLERVAGTVIAQGRDAFL